MYSNLRVWKSEPATRNRTLKQPSQCPAILLSVSKHKDFTVECRSRRRCCLEEDTQSNLAVLVSPLTLGGQVSCP